MAATAEQPVQHIPLASVLLDMLIAAISLASSWVLNEHRIMNPFRRGFFCDDNSIKHTYKGSTVEDPCLYSLTVCFPLLTISVLEAWDAWGGGAAAEARRRRRVLLGSWSLPQWLYRWLRALLLFAFGYGVHETTVNVAKFTTGRLRPHFLDVCRPDVQCNATGVDPHAYITDYRCTGPAGDALFQSRLSFPSGHAAASFFAAAFIVMYMERRVRWPERLVVLKTLYESLAVIVATFIALSRLMDFKHHPTDVAAGSVIGAAIAIFWVLFVMNVRRSREEESCREETTYMFQPDGTPLTEKP